MFHFRSLARALSDENRARILMALCRSPLCVCHITAFLDLAPSTTSKHLSILRQCGLIESCKQGRWVYYRLPERPVSPCVAAALKWVTASLAEDERVAADAARIEELLRNERDMALEGSCHSLGAHSLDAALNPEETEAFREETESCPTLTPCTT